MQHRASHPRRSCTHKTWEHQVSYIAFEQTGYKVIIAGSEVMKRSTVSNMRSCHDIGSMSRKAPMILMSGLSLLDQPSSTRVVTTTVLTMPFKFTWCRRICEQAVIGSVKNMQMSNRSQPNQVDIRQTMSICL